MLVEKSMHPDWLSNAFLVATEGGPAVFVDSGAEVAPLIEAVERWGVTPVAILRTHAHHECWFDPHCAVNSRDGRSALNSRHFRHWHQKKICEREKDHDRRCADPQNGL